MSTLTVKRYLDIKDLPSFIDRNSLSNNGAGREMANYIVVERNGEPVFVESDAMEPEDARFTRDLNWVPQAIAYAYQVGREDAMAELSGHQ